jgi:protein-S-isoprenylcysteine O-methyltransferase Ste14
MSLNTPLSREFERRGQWLFRWRSYLPLLLLPFAAVAMWYQQRLGRLPGTMETVYQVICLLVALAGVATRMIAIGYAQPGTSGKNTKEQIADHLNTSGLYSVCRHPLYLGNVVMFTGLVMFTESVFFILFAVLAYWMYYERIAATEEKYLTMKYGEQYVKWGEETPFMLPRWSHWRTPEYAFDLRAAIRGEVYGLGALGSVFLVLEILRNGFAGNWISIDFLWAGFFVATLLIWFVGRFLRKYTRVLG